MSDTSDELNQDYQTLVIGLPVAFIGRDALVKNKRATGRAKDLIDLDLLRAERRRDDG